MFWPYWFFFVQPAKNHQVSPQSYFTSLLKTRGYGNKPTPLQIVSNGMKFIDAIRGNNIGALRQLLEAGLSPNAANEHGESVVHMTCRVGHKDCLKVLIEHSMAPAGWEWTRFHPCSLIQEERFILLSFGQIGTNRWFLAVWRILTPLSTHSMMQF